MTGSSLTAFKENEKWGYKNNMGKVVIDPVYLYVPTDFKFFTEILVDADDQENSVYYLYDRSGNRLFSFNDLIEEEIFGVFRFKETNLFLVDVYDFAGNEQTAMVNETGKVVIPPTFDSIEAVGEGLFKVYFTNPNEKVDELGNLIVNKYGVYDSEGKEVFAPQFSSIEDFDDSVAIALLNDQAMLISNKGIIIKGSESKSIEKVTKCHYILHKENGSQLFIWPDRFGKIYDYIESVDNINTYFIAGKNAKAILVDSHLNDLGEYESLLEDSDRLLARKNNKWGIIDYRNGVISDFLFDHIDFFDEKSYVIRLNQKYGLIDKMGQEIIPATFETDDLLFEKFNVPDRKRNIELR